MQDERQIYRRLPLPLVMWEKQEECALSNTNTENTKNP